MLMEKGKKRIIGAFRQLRLRNEGVQTVSKLLTESRAENKILKDRNSHLERTVDSLNNKLQRAGVSNDTKSFNSVPNDEPSNAAPSRALLENLVRENSRLKQHIHSPQKIDEINMRACSLQSLNTDLRREKDVLEQQLNDLRDAIRGSDNSKDQYILRLVDDLKDNRLKYDQEQQHRITLEHQIHKLNEELTDTASKLLNMRKHPSTSITTAAISSSHTTTVTQSQAVDHSLHDKNKRLEMRCHQLEQELHSLKTKSPAVISQTSDQMFKENLQLKQKLQERDNEITQLKDTVEMLKHTLAAHKEDFDKAESERQHLIQRVRQLQQDKGHSHQPMSKSQPTSNNAWDGRQASRPKTQPVRYNTPVPSSVSQPSLKQSAQPVNRTLSSKSKEDNVSLSSQTDVVRPSLSAKNQTSNLACYKCGKEFSRDKHSDLIDHLDVCDVNS